jgi:hypothetical protein
MGVGGSRYALAALPLEKKPGTHYTGGWVGTRLGLDGYRNSRPPTRFDPHTVQPMVSCHTNYTIPGGRGGRKKYIWKQKKDRKERTDRKIWTRLNAYLTFASLLDPYLLAYQKICLSKQRMIITFSLPRHLVTCLNQVININPLFSKSRRRTLFWLRHLWHI